MTTSLSLIEQASYRRRVRTVQARWSGSEGATGNLMESKRVPKRVLEMGTEDGTTRPYPHALHTMDE
ncbi:hypothetical protein RJ55_00238 [Drechmeria coniospora]|nr:hypothetical protein RJ55_00238 [Drechmeria coniospora]